MDKLGTRRGIRDSGSGHKDAGLVSKHRGIVSQMETEILLMHLLDCSKVDLYINDIKTDDEIERQYDLLVKRRLDGEPIQYITGKTEFCGFDFIVNENVFIPRPETELLVNEIMSSGVGRLASGARILDLCTGSGNIAVSMAKLMPEAEIIATDISSEALKIAQENAIYNETNGRIKFLQGDLFNALENENVDNNNKFDIIISNPPYIRADEIRFLQKEICFEPEIALNGGNDGLDFYRRIAAEASSHLNKGGTLFLEIGAGQALEIINIFNTADKFKVNRVIKDFNGIERVLWINS